MRQAVNSAMLSAWDQDSLEELVWTMGCGMRTTSSGGIELALELWIAGPRCDAADKCSEDMHRLKYSKYPRVSIRIDEVSRYLDDLNDTVELMSYLEYSDREIKEFLTRCLGVITVHLQVLNVLPTITEMDTCPPETKLSHLRSLFPYALRKCLSFVNGLSLF